MKKRISTILMACAMLFCFTTSCTDDLVDVSTLGTISGTVIDVDSGDPIQNATVNLSPGGLNTYTGSDGSFEFLDLKDPQYQITVQKTGYITNRKSVTTKAGGVATVQITLKKNN